MHITMSDMMPVSLCLATHELFDAKRFQQNFGDYCLLRSRSEDMENTIWPLKRELGSSQYQKKYIEGHKAVIVSNIDKILSLVASRYGNMTIKAIEVIIRDGKSIMKKVVQSDSFDDILFLEPAFKSKILLPVYELFLENNKRSAGV